MFFLREARVVTHSKRNRSQFAGNPHVENGNTSTLPRTNIAPENGPSQKESIIPTIHFQVRTASFRDFILFPWWKCSKSSIVSMDKTVASCWWLKSCTTKDDDYPIIYRVLTIPGGAGFQPSTVLSAAHLFLAQLFSNEETLMTEESDNSSEVYKWL